MPNYIEPNAILRCFEQRPSKPLSIPQILDILHISKHLKREVKHAMRSLINKGQLVAVSSSHYALKSASVGPLENPARNKDKKPPMSSNPRVATQTPIEEMTLVSEVKQLLRSAKVPEEFSPVAEVFAKEFGQEPSEQDKKNRTDITHLPLCTIDGETAKDFDDAVYAEPHEKGFRVVVAIADVAFYVDQGGPIDQEAFERATSIYYPGHCIPMLPEALSNGLCSLKPKVDRLCMVADMVIGPRGSVLKSQFYSAVMHSQARLTYTAVQKYLNGDAEIEAQIPKPVQKSIKVLQQAAKILREARTKRGAIDFDAVESIVALDDRGEPISIHPEERLDSHRLIEDLMIAANEAVARFLEEKERPTIFRIHEMPDAEKLANFLQMAQTLGAISPRMYALVKQDPSSKHLAQLSKQLASHQARGALDSLLLRSMMQARYSAHNLGHFGLASKSYLHFTSPIRRYPDLVVHRVLRAYLEHKRTKLSAVQHEKMTEDLEQVAAHCSDKERAATDLERKIDSLYSAWFMRDKVGLVDEATVASVTEFGLFVRLSKYPVEGLLHVAQLKGGYYRYDPKTVTLADDRSKIRYGIGDKIKVRLTGVSIAKRYIDFELADAPASKPGFSARPPYPEKRKPFKSAERGKPKKRSKRR